MESAKLYDIRDAARLIGVAPSTLRYWEREGLVRSLRNRANDYRQYSLHDLIEASEIAFYRQLGVPVKELRGYRGFTASQLDRALGRTEEGIERRIAELEAVRARLAQQRALDACASELQKAGMRPGSPAPARLSAADYGEPAIWTLLASEPWRYGVVVRADDPATVLEAVVDAPPARAEVLWERQEERQRDGAGDTGFECLLRVDPDGNGSNAPDLFAEARARGAAPALIVGTYLLTAADEGDAHRWDLFRAWVVAARRTQMSSRPERTK